MIHLRIVAPQALADEAVALLEGCESVVNVVRLAGVASNPAGDLVLCDVAHEDAIVGVADLRELGIPECGSIALEEIDTEVSAAGDRAVRLARGDPADAVVWEQVATRTSESSTLSATYLIFMALAALIAAWGSSSTRRSSSSAPWWSAPNSAPSRASAWPQCSAARRWPCAAAWRS